MTDVEIKARVRERDGYKCRDCGMTREQHLKDHDHDLEVHRLLPGSEYSIDGCVTLCHDCHAKKPRNLDGVIFSNSHGSDCSGLLLLRFNLYNEATARLINCLQHKADGLDLSLDGLIVQVLTEYVDGVQPDYVI